MTGTLNYNGTGSFSYTVTAGLVSNSGTANLTISSINDAPVTTNLTPTPVNEDTQKIITLAYTDADGDQATTCALSSLSNITITQGCACSSGVCTVGVTGTNNFNGTASFNYTVTAGVVSNSSSASFTITAVDDAPAAINITPAAFNEDTQSIITLTYTDVEGDQANACAISSPLNVTVTQACSCTLGVCTVGVTGTNNYAGTASFNYTVTANLLVSNSATASLTVSAVNDPPAAANFTAPAFSEDTQSIITLSYSDAEMDQATSCAITSPTNVTVTQACACASGVCTVGVTGVANYNGAASFAYTVTAGVASNSATATLVINNVNDAPVAANITPAALSTSVQSIITLSYTDADLDQATTCALSSLVNVTVTQACACSTGTCTVGVTSSSYGAGSFNYTVTANGQASNSASATFTINLNCPTGFIEIPGNASLGTRNFCVMQFEAKNNSGAKSEPAGVPWANISITNAEAACVALGANHHLISNPEWMTIARNIESVSTNWMSGVVGVGGMFMGHSQSGASELSITNINDFYDQTGNSASDAAGSGLEQRRIMNLSNGKVIWDFAGNIEEWVDAELIPGLQPFNTCLAFEEGTLDQLNCKDMTDEDIYPAQKPFTPANNFGSYLQQNLLSYSVKGGGVYYDINGGLYTFDASYDANYSDTYTGFRCVYRPTLADQPPVAFNRNISFSTKEGSRVIQVRYTDPNGDAATSCSTSGATNLTITQACSCSSGTCTVGVSGNSSGTGTLNFTVTANGVTSNTATITADLFVCPAGYIDVPANASLGVKSFCVMKYEAKASGTKPISVPAGLPYISYVYDDTCDENGPQYKRISNPEWMAIARNIENVSTNWTGGAVGSGSIYKGHSDGTPASMLAVTNTNDPYDGTGNVAPSNQRRTHQLSNGEEIWDFSGNAREIIHWGPSINQSYYSPYCDQGAFELGANNCPALAPNSILPSNVSYTSAQGIGMFLGGGLDSAIRGGSYLTSTYAGIYTLDFIPDNASIADGTRCIWRPETADTAPVAYNISPHIAIGAKSTITLEYSDPDGNSATACTTSNLNNITVITACACASGICKVGVAANTSGAASFDYTVTANSVVSNTASVTTTNVFDCPSNYVKVPGNAALGTSDFCAMKYEAKNYAGVATSSPYRSPWNSQTAATYANNCVNLGTGYFIMSNPEWMTIARNMENVSSNWSGGSVGSGCVWGGNVGVNGTCTYDGNDMYTLDFGFPRNTKARLTLSNGEVMWDLTGNILEYVDYNMSAPGFQGIPNAGCSTASNINNHTCVQVPDDSFKTANLTYNLGQITGSNSTLMRGGNYNRPNYGLYGVMLQSNGAFGYVGFRCVYRPTTTAGAPVLYAIGPQTAAEDVATTITLSYVDPNGDAASACTISNLVNMVVSTACTCTSGVCTVGVKSTSNYSGAGSFDYTITANGDTTAAKTANFTFTAVDDAPVVANTNFTPLQANVQSIITLPYTDPEDQATACTLSSLVNVTVSQACACTGGVCTVGLTSATPGDASFAFSVTANAVTSNTATGTIGTCPVNYASVPGNTALGTTGFCVMQFEARDVGSVATSSASDPLWTNIGRTNAKTACTNLGTKYDLIANNEWMTIARNVERVAANWTSGVVDSGMLYRGASDNTPGSPQIVSDTSNIYNQTGNSSADAEGAGKEQARRLTLANGQYIWDFAGNAWEHVDYSKTTGMQDAPNTCNQNDVELNVVNCAALPVDAYMPVNGTLDSIYGVGKFYASLAGGLKRGGSHNSSSGSGIYAYRTTNNNTTTSGDTGFRCVWRP